MPTVLAVWTNGRNMSQTAATDVPVYTSENKITCVPKVKYPKSYPGTDVSISVSEMVNRNNPCFAEEKCWVDKHSCKLAGLFKCQSMNLGTPVCTFCFVIFSRAVQTNTYPQLTWQRLSFSQLCGKSEPALFSFQVII